jgi:VanZ family protein
MTIRVLLHLFRRLVAYALVPALLLVVFGELTHSHLAEELEFHTWDKALHFTAYFGLALMATVAVRADRRACFWAVGLILLGGGLELVQGATGRDADIWDEAANTLGVLAGYGVARIGIGLLKARRLIEDDGPQP